MKVSKFLFAALFTMTALSAPLASMGTQPNIGVISSSEEALRHEWAFSDFADEILTFLNPGLPAPQGEVRQPTRVLWLIFAAKLGYEGIRLAIQALAEAK